MSVSQDITTNSDEMSTSALALSTNSNKNNTLSKNSWTFESRESMMKNTEKDLNSGLEWFWKLNDLSIYRRAWMAFS